MSSLSIGKDFMSHFGKVQGRAMNGETAQLFGITIQFDWRGDGLSEAGMDS